MLCYAKSPEWTLSSTYMSHTLGKLTSRIIDRRLKYTSTDYKYSHIKRKRILLSENLFFRIFINWTHQNANGSMKSEFSSKPTLCVHRSNNVAQIWKKNRRDFVWNCRCWRSCLPPLYSQVECSCEYLSSIVKKLFVWLVKFVVNGFGMCSPDHFRTDPKKHMNQSQNRMSSDLFEQWIRIVLLIQTIILVYFLLFSYRMLADAFNIRSLDDTWLVMELRAKGLSCIFHAQSNTNAMSYIRFRHNATIPNIFS